MTGLSEKFDERIHLGDGHPLAARPPVSERVLDVIAALTILVFTLPLTVAAGIALMIAGGGHAFERRDRMGVGGHPCRGLYFKCIRDDRFTAPGRWVHALRIDHIPLCINVIAGDLSFFGSRSAHPFREADGSPDESR